MKTIARYISVLLLLASVLTFVPTRTMSTVLLVSAALTWWVFVAWYAIRSNWHHNPYGRNTMGTALGIAVILTVFSATALFPHYDNYELVWALAALNLMMLGIEHTYYMERAQRDKERVHATHKR